MSLMRRRRSRPTKRLIKDVGLLMLSLCVLSIVSSSPSRLPVLTDSLSSGEGAANTLRNDGSDLLSSATAPVDSAGDPPDIAQATLDGVVVFSDFSNSIAEGQTALYMKIGRGLVDIATDPLPSPSEGVRNAYVITQAVYASEVRIIHTGLRDAGSELAQTATAFSDYGASYRLSRSRELAPQ